MKQYCRIILFAALLVTLACAPVSSGESKATVTDTSQVSPSSRMPRITIHELLQKIDNKEEITIVDTRSNVEEIFESGHIKGALPMPLTNISSGQWEPEAGKEIIVYCTCPEDRTAAIAALEMIKRGHSNVKVLEDGYNA